MCGRRCSSVFVSPNDDDQNNTNNHYIDQQHQHQHQPTTNSVGAAVADDVVVYEETDEAFYVGLGRSHSERLLYVHSGSAVTRLVFVGCDEGEVLL